MDLVVKILKNYTNKISSAIAISMCALLMSASHAGTVEDSIAERIKAFHSICIEGQDCAKKMAVGPVAARTAEEVYNSGCLACHTSGAAGAPRFRIAADWTDRLKQGLDTLYINAIKGKGAMPAKGLCPDCSDKEIELAVDYMLEGI